MCVCVCGGGSETSFEGHDFNTELIMYTVSYTYLL